MLDPNAALKQLRAQVRASKETLDSDHDPEPEELEERLNAIVDLFTGLDGWISGGGFLPSAWRKQVAG